MIVNILWVSVGMVFMVILSEAKVVWEVQKPISEYGEDLELNCIAVDYNMSLQSSKRWYQGQTLLTFNDGSEDNTKYNASLISNGYKLIIKNLTKNDVNITYMCSDGFDKSENLPLLAKDVFKKDVPAHKGELKESNSNIAVILGIVIGAFIVILISVFAILYKRGRLVMVTKICFNRDPQNATDPYGEVEYDAVPPNETNGTDNQQTNIVLFEDIEALRNASYTSQTGSLGVLCDDNSMEPIFVTSLSRLSDCIAPQSQHSDDEDNETSHAADTERSIVTSQQEVVVVSNNGSHISNPNQEDEFIISSAKFPAYSKKRVREQSFTEWSLSEPSKQKMASAGFFYKGCNTYAQCFCCGFNHKWRQNDDPFSCSLHNDNCSYSQKVNISSVQDRNPRSADNEETNPKLME